MMIKHWKSATRTSRDFARFSDGTATCLGCGNRCPESYCPACLREKLADRFDRRAGNLQQIVERIATETIVPADPCKVNAKACDVSEAGEGAACPPERCQLSDPKIYRVCWQHRRTKKISCSPWMGHAEATARIERVICSTHHEYWLERKFNNHALLLALLQQFVADAIRTAKNSFGPGEYRDEWRLEDPEHFGLVVRTEQILAQHGYSRVEVP